MGDSYRDLLVWKKAMELAKDIYRVTDSFPQKEIYGLTSQIKKAAISVPCNVAEGKGRLGKGEFRQFLGIARGSLMELETQIILSCDFGYIEGTDANKLLAQSAEVGRMLNGLISKISA